MEQNQTEKQFNIHIDYLRHDLTEIKDIIKSNHSETKSKIEACEKEIIGLKLENAGTIEKFIRNNKKLLIAIVLVLTGSGGLPGIMAILDKLQ